ncbi:hypothetical protein BY996DRAFT_6648095 [Phakopsora pachyrhizi]|nr:hypothetical protein BY996DRAFT_6648095 [Phakopsora pachyrhizi]
MNCGKQQSFTEALNFVNSLAGLPCPNPYGILPVCLPGYPQPFLDPQSLAASVAQFGNPLMDFYGVSPALMAARANALSQLAAGDIGADLSDPASADDGTNSSSKKTNLYKTELCRSWEEKGSCRYGFFA